MKNLCAFLLVLITVTTLACSPSKPAPDSASTPANAPAQAPANTPVDADEIVIGLAREKRVYLIVAAARIPRREDCGVGSTEYAACFARHLADHPDFPKLAAQVETLRGPIPDG